VGIDGFALRRGVSSAPMALRGANAILCMFPFTLCSRLEVEISEVQAEFKRGATDFKRSNAKK
jgi:hypothetical protein